MSKHKVKVIKVIQVGRSRFSTMPPAVNAISQAIAYNLWGTFRDKYFYSKENYMAIHRLQAKAKRRVSPILERMFNSDYAMLGPKD